MIDLTLKQTLVKLKSKEISSVELTKSYLERIKKVDPQINAFVTVTEEEALKSAEDADARRASGSDLPLLGIPYSMKGVYSTKKCKNNC